MKHLYISVFIFITIIAGSIISNVYAGKVLDDILYVVDDFTEKEEIIDSDINRIGDIKKVFYNKKNMLQLFINKEHIENIEIDIIQLESAVKDKDVEQSKEKSIDTVYTLEFIKDNLVAFD